MKTEGISKRKNGLIRFKFCCPKVKWIKTEEGKQKRYCSCENPCTSSSCGRMFYIYPEKDLRAYPGTIRGTEEWDETYKTRTVVEQSINHFKDSFCIAGRKTQNEKTLHADLLLAGITQLITVILADKLHHHQYIRSLKPLIA
jgi:transposase